MTVSLLRSGWTLTVSHPAQFLGLLLKGSSDRNRSLHLELEASVHGGWVHAHANQRRGARSCGWAVTSPEAACESAVLGTSVLVLEDALRLRVRHVLREVSRAATRGIARGSAQRASTLEVTGDLVIQARRSLVVVVVTRSRSWGWCGRRSWRWGWCRARGTADGWEGWRAISDAALVHATLDQHVAVVTPRCSPGVLHLPVVSAAGGAIA